MKKKEGKKINIRKKLYKLILDCIRINIKKCEIYASEIKN